jgi:hypothetical protein
MFVQVLLAEHLAGLHSPQFDLAVSTAIALFSFNSNGHDIVWEVSNRICDRYLPKLKQA